MSISTAAIHWRGIAPLRAEGRIPNARGTHIVKGCGHWIQQERVDDTHRVILGVLDAL